MAVLCVILCRRMLFHQRQKHLSITVSIHGIKMKRCVVVVLVLVLVVGGVVVVAVIVIIVVLSA